MRYLMKHNWIQDFHQNDLYTFQTFRIWIGTQPKHTIDYRFMTRKTTYLRNVTGTVWYGYCCHIAIDLMMSHCQSPYYFWVTAVRACMKISELPVRGVKIANKRESQWAFMNTAAAEWQLRLSNVFLQQVFLQQSVEHLNCTHICTSFLPILEDFFTLSLLQARPPISALNQETLNMYLLEGQSCILVPFSEWITFTPSITMTVSCSFNYNKYKLVLPEHETEKVA